MQKAPMDNIAPEPSVSTSSWRSGCSPAEPYPSGRYL